jgi:tetrapyrrole methylase family protein/MazG family protein
LLASELKCRLSDWYEADQPVLTVGWSGGYIPKVKEIKLEQSDQEGIFDYTTCWCISPVPLIKRKKHSYDDLVQIMQILRSPSGCPWDKEQSHSSLERNLIEEAYEVIDAIDKQDEFELCDELGDVLFAAINVARFIKVHPEFALKSTVEKFIRRFEFVEQQSSIDGKKLENMSLNQMDEYWDRAKLKGL